MAIYNRCYATGAEFDAVVGGVEPTLASKLLTSPKRRGVGVNASTAKKIGRQGQRTDVHTCTYCPLYSTTR